jgi:DNA-binding CsgD family transcriptional regulator
MKFILAIAFSVLFSSESIHSFAVQNYQNTNFRISIFRDSSNTIGIEKVKAILKTNPDLFIPSGHIDGPFSPNVTYWLHILPENTGGTQRYILAIHKRLSLIEVFPYSFTNISSYGGFMVPGKLKTFSGCNVLLSSGSSAYLVKIQNRLWTNVSVKDLEFIPNVAFQREQLKTNLMQGFIQGLFWLMLLYNLFLYFLAKQKIHLFYVIYIFLNSLYLFFSFGYSEIYIFPHNYRLNLIFLTFQLIGVFFYILFLRQAFLNHCSSYTPATDRRSFLPYAYVMLVVNLFLASSVFYRIDIFVKIAGYSNILNGIVAITTFIYYHKTSNWFVRTIMAGSVMLILCGWVTVLKDMLYMPSDDLPYEAGLLLEIIIFTYALNKQHICDIEEKYKAELMKCQLESELDSKNRKLVCQAMQLSAKDETITTIKAKIKEYKIAHINKLEGFNPIEVEINGYANEHLWKEFEVHFNGTHPKFYKTLMIKYPKLTQNEIKLCAFLKLNLNTKEIAMITKKSARSIEVMRSRIRQKMGLPRDTNLNQVLMQY